MLNLDLIGKKSEAGNSESIQLINTYLKTLASEAFSLPSKRKVKENADGILIEYGHENKLGKIKLADVEKMETEVKEAKKDYSFRAFLNYHNRGIVQEAVTATMTTDMPTRCKLADTAKVLIGIGAASVATGAVAQALFGAEDYDKFWGASFEKLAKNFLLGNENYDSLVPAVAGTVAALAAVKLSSAAVSYPRTKQEAREFDDYVDLKHAQIGLKRLKRAVKKEAKKRIYR